MVPAWLTVVISLGGAIIAGAAASVTQLVTARTERGKELYSRRIDAAGEFSACALDTLSVVRDAVREGAVVADDPEEREAKERKALGLLHKAEARQAFVGLLFAKEPDVARGECALEALRVAVLKMTKKKPEEEVRKLCDRAEGQLKNFHQAVLDVLKRRRRFSLLKWMPRRFRSTQSNSEGPADAGPSETCSYEL
jgi:hypothetical protein